MNKVIILIFAFLFLSKVCFAGIDLTLNASSSLELPFFKSNVEAIMYAHEVKWVEEILVEYKKRLADLNNDAWDREIGWMWPEQRGRKNMYRDQRDWIALTVSIMEDYKKQGIKGSSPVGAVVYASCETLPKKKK